MLGLLKRAGNDLFASTTASVASTGTRLVRAADVLEAAGFRGLLEWSEDRPAPKTAAGVSPLARVSPSATVVGSVMIGDGAQIGDNAVVRSGTATVEIGRRTVLGPRVVVRAAHFDRYSPLTGLRNRMQIGSNVTVGEGSVLESCVVEDGVKIGKRVIVGEGAIVQKGAVLGDDTVVPAGRLVPFDSYWQGSPAKHLGPAPVDDGHH